MTGGKLALNSGYMPLLVIISSSHWPIEGDILDYALTHEHPYTSRSHYTRACVVQKLILGK